MLKRTLMFTNPMRLMLKQQQIVIWDKEQEANSPLATVPIEDIGIVVVENQRVSISIPLLNALADANVMVVFCDAKGMPKSLLTNMDSNDTQCEILNLQIACGEVLKKQLWKQLVEAKIKNQAALLSKLNKDGELLKPYYNNVKSGDADNREGAAAHLYWQMLFGKGFVRDREWPGVNTLLNYGYTILRAATARAIVSSGLLPAVGLFHHNRSNAFPLADDLMEPFRPYVDEVVYQLAESDNLELNKETKALLIQVLYADTQFNKVLRPLSVGLTMTTASLVKCLEKEATKLSLPRF